MKPIPLEPDDRRLVVWLRAMAHPARLRILRLLAERDACMCGAIVDELPLSQATVSQHLKVLKEAGLIKGEIDGPKVCYCIAPGSLSALQAEIGRFVTAVQTPELQRLVNTKNGECDA